MHDTNWTTRPWHRDWLKARYGTLDALVEAGMDPRRMRADVFAYAPRA